MIQTSDLSQHPLMPTFRDTLAEALAKQGIPPLAPSLRHRATLQCATVVDALLKTGATPQVIFVATVATLSESLSTHSAALEQLSYPRWALEATNVFLEGALGSVLLAQAIPQ